MKRLIDMICGKLYIRVYGVGGKLLKAVQKMYVDIVGFESGYSNG